MAKPPHDVYKNHIEACGTNNVLYYTPQSLHSPPPRKGFNMVGLMPALNRSLQTHCTDFLVIETDMLLMPHRMHKITDLMLYYPGSVLQMGNAYLLPRHALVGLVGAFPTIFRYANNKEAVHPHLGCPVGMRTPLPLNTCAQDMMLPRMLAQIGIGMRGMGGCAKDILNVCFELKYAHNIPNIVGAACNKSVYGALNIDQQQYMDRKTSATIFHHCDADNFKSLPSCL